VNPYYRANAFAPADEAEAQQGNEATDSDVVYDSAKDARVERAGEEAAQIADAVKQGVRHEMGSIDQEVRKDVNSEVCMIPRVHVLV
jgi:hypothetical protein